MHFGSMFVTFFAAVLYGILRVMMEGDATVALLFCIPVTLICTIVGLIKSEGKSKLLVIPVQIVIWLICSVFGMGIFKGIFAIVLVAIGAVVLFLVLSNMFGSDKKSSQEDVEAPKEMKFADSLPAELIDEDGKHWFRDYEGPNVVRYHCNTSGESTELYEGQTNVYSNQAVGNDGRRYHWN